ncbi:MAG: hypothetical protein Q7T74_00990 [Candidatus Saccharibacteria bacterium]|nr:hypothetical protein [Candidatus Saccharibacteria bacterium]
MYTSLSKSAASAAQASIEPTGASYGLSTDTIKDISLKAFPASDVQKKSESLIDDSYSWLNGKHQKLVIKFDFNANTQVLMSGLADEIVKTTFTKPICSAEQLQQSIDPTALLQVCRPANLDAMVLKEALTTSTSQAADVTQAASSNLPGGTNVMQNNGALAELDNNVQGVSIPFTFSILKNSFYILIILTLLVVSGMYGLTRERRTFLSLVAHPLLTTGLLLVIYAASSQWLIAQHFLSKFVPGEQTQLTEDTIQHFTSVGAWTVVSFGATYLVTALAIYIYNYQQKKKQHVGKLAREVTKAKTVV